MMETNAATKRRLPARLLRLGAWVIGIIALIGLGVFLGQAGLIPGLTVRTPGSTSREAIIAARAAEQAAQTTATQDSLVPLRPSTEGIGLVSAAGNLELAGEQQVVVEVGGIVRAILVEVGDMVEAGDLLVQLDAREAEEAVQQALLDYSAAQADLNELLTGASAAEIAAAEATLRSAQAKLADVMDGPSEQELAAASASLTAAQANYNDLMAPPGNEELIQLEANLRKAEVTLAEAQGNYNKVAWQNNVGMTSEAAELQSATIDYESAKAAYDEASAPAASGDVQSALSNIQSAQQTVADLQAQPSAADVAAAQADVANAEQALQELLDGTDGATLEAAQVALAQAQLNVESAAADLANTELRAPAAGTILSVELATGQQVSEGSTALTLADAANLQLTVNVAEMDVEQLEVGMAAEIAIDALPGQSFTGEVLRIAPASDPEQSVVNYPVTIQLTDDNLSGVRAGMTAVAEMRSASLTDAWLAPLTAVQEMDGESQMVVIRDGAQLTIPVTTGQIQGEWVVVESPELQEGDQVMASLAT
jgi:HlyD family secretion protein